MTNVTNAATITVVATGERFHTLDDWGLAIGNNDYIGAPEYEQNTVDVPGRCGYLDMTEAVTGRLIYKSRAISIKFGGLRDCADWDGEVSSIRNKLHGQRVNVVFDNDASYYWTGRAEVNDFDRARRLGTFTLDIPNAEPYKYELYSSTEEWEWDSFDFENDVDRYIGSVAVDGSYSVVIPKGDMLTVPVFMAEVDGALSVVFDGVDYPLGNGRNRFPKILVCGAEEKELVFRGRGTVSVDYRGGSL